MMFGKLGQLVPFLLASSTSVQELSTTTSSTSTATTTTTPAPLLPLDPAPPATTLTSLKGIRQSMDEMYRDLLDEPGAITTQMSPTLQFSYVSPPINGTSTWRLSQQQQQQQDQQLSSPLLTPDEPNSNKKKPIAIYLPGLDGSGISAFNHQFDDMAETFELWRLVIDTTDRSEFRQVLSSVVEFVEEIAKAEDGDEREIVLVGESFGGVLASAVALNVQKRAKVRSHQKYRNPLKGLVLVNPATAFHDTNWDVIVPILASLQYLSNNNDTSTTTSTDTASPTPYSLTGGLALSYLMPDNNQLSRIGQVVLDAVGNSQPPEAVEDMISLLEILEERLPADTLQHRVSQWLTVGTSLVNERLQDLELPTLVVAGDQDRIMPSDKEVKRLEGVISSCETLVVRGRGHFVLDENVNLTEAILYSDIDPLNWKQGGKDKYDPIKDWTLPPKEEIQAVIDSRVKPLRNIHSPVFFCTDKRGKRWRGLAKIPQTDGPILFVANHQFFGLDLSLIVAELLEERNMICRGLGHPVLFNRTKDYPELLGRTPGLISPVSDGGAAGGFNNFNNYQQFGAVEVSPRNYYKLMQTGQTGLLFPGGVKDVFCTDRTYPLNWPEKQDFVRTAARFNATIIPLSAVGMLESARILVEAEDLTRIPFVGKRIAEGPSPFPAARFDAAEGESDPSPPIPFPDVPKRNYFVFGKPFTTSEINPKDKEACAKLYKEVVAETRRGIDDIFLARKDDPFYDTPRRLAFERLTGKKAPTFGIDKLNRKL